MNTPSSSALLVTNLVPEVPSCRKLPRYTVNCDSATCQLVLSWLLMLSMVFLATHGNLSFEAGTDNNSGSLSGFAPTRHSGVFGYILPGIAYSILLWQIASFLKPIVSLAFRMKTFTILAFVAICSSAWSQDPLRSAYSGVFYLISTLFAFYLVVRFPPRQLMNLVMLAGAVICLLDLFLVIFFPQYGIGAVEGRTAGAWRGLFAYRTGASTCLTYLLTPALVFGYRRISLRRVTYIILLLTSIVMARSVTALIMTALYTLFMLGLHFVKRLEKKSAIGLSMFVVGIAGALAWIMAPYAGAILAFFGRDSTLTGRTGIWASLITSILKRPLFGYGYSAFWQGLKGESAHVILSSHWMFAYAHNGYLEILLQLGVLGLAIAFVVLFHAGKDALVCFRAKQSMDIDWYIGLIALTVMYNIDEETMFWPNDLLSVLFVVACCGLSLAASRIRYERKVMNSTPQILTSV